MEADLVLIRAVYFDQPTVDLLMDVENMQPHLPLRGFQLALQLLQQRLTVTRTSWCLRGTVNLSTIQYSANVFC